MSGEYTAAQREALAKLREGVRCRVVERACIMAEACGLTWPEAMRIALETEAEQPKLPGVR